MSSTPHGMPTFDPRRRFPDFYANPAIRALAGACRWTVSGQLGANPEGDMAPVATRKAPIDIRHLVAGCTTSCVHEGPVRGAWSISPACLMTLDEILDQLPQVTNHAFYLQAPTDGLIVIDIEPGCPQDVALDLLRLPGILYAETSMSGKGYHLITGLPGNLHDLPYAADKRVLRHPEGWYEILLDHWATFTRHPVPAQTLELAQRRTQPPAITSVEDLYTQLGEQARKNPQALASSIDTQTEMPEIPYSIRIVSGTLRMAEGHLKTPQAFNDDLSRWEFSILGSLYGWLRTQIDVYRATGVEYSVAETAWLLFAAAREVIPDRPKHHELRNDRPFLLDRAAALVAARQKDDKGSH